MTKKIAVPYFTGSNGDIDALARIKEVGMTPVPLYFNLGDTARLEENKERLLACDGAVIPGGFPYEDRLGYGIVPARIPAFADGMRQMVESGKPVIAFCSGNQIAQAIGLAFPIGSPYKVRMLPNIADREGKIMHYGFKDGKTYTQLAVPPERTAFTRNYTDGEIIEDLYDHGGGRFWADEQTLRHILEQGMVVTRYVDKKGNPTNEFPTNPNGSLLNIESITNRRGNLKIGMCHNERQMYAGRRGANNEVFASMREFIEDKFPDLSGHAETQDIPLEFKDFSYLDSALNPETTWSIYIEMLTDDNERNTAELFMGLPLERRRLIQLDLGTRDERVAQQALETLAGMDFLAGIMLKKDLPTITTEGKDIWTYSVTGKEGGKLVREFVKEAELVHGFPVSHTLTTQPNPEPYHLREQLSRNPTLKQQVKGVQTGTVWFFRSEDEKAVTLEKLLDT